jgi:hypothetical protein
MTKPYGKEYQFEEDIYTTLLIQFFIGKTSILIIYYYFQQGL